MLIIYTDYITCNSYKGYINKALGNLKSKVLAGKSADFTLQF